MEKFKLLLYLDWYNFNIEGNFFSCLVDNIYVLEMNIINFILVYWGYREIM